MKFIICTPFYRDNSGGIIVLHKLAAMLRDAGHTVFIWPQAKPSLQELRTIKGWIKCVRYVWIRIKAIVKGRNIKSPYNLNIASNKSLSNAIAIYPEIVKGNPLGKKRVVRWLLNKPGVITGDAEFNDDELFFYYHPHFNDWTLNPYEERHLNVTELMSDVYKKTNNSERTGQCYMVRKGSDRTLNYHENDAKNVDGLSHDELSKNFNDCKYFICYDLYTMYCRYAAMCGCIPVVVPQEGLSKEDWRPELANRYGIAYGWDDVSWAVESRTKLIDYLAETEERSIKSVRIFLDIVENHFKI